LRHECVPASFALPGLKNNRKTSFDFLPISYLLLATLLPTTLLAESDAESAVGDIRDGLSPTKSNLF
jgi:hypothetical protein